jgi:F-type H+-transporting ATPase subunit a
MVQAYIFSILAAVYIAAATQVQKPGPTPADTPNPVAPTPAN